MTDQKGAAMPDQVPPPTGGQETVNGVLTPNKSGRVVETAEFAAFTRRIIKAYGRRIGQHGDVDALPELVALAGEIDAVIQQSVTGLRAEGYTWTEISSRLGTTRQAAQQRFGTNRTNDTATREDH